MTLANSSIETIKTLNNFLFFFNYTYIADFVDPCTDKLKKKMHLYWNIFTYRN